MKLHLKRTFLGDKYTIGRLTIDDVYFCDTLEDVERDIKIPKETCIPRGPYKVVMDFSTRFQEVMPHILDVPNFEGIRIHAGNTAADTEGCILLGTNSMPGMVTNSRVIFGLFYDRIKNVKDEITITIEA
jgi:hypothetical protein